VGARLRPVVPCGQGGAAQRASLAERIGYGPLSDDSSFELPLPRHDTGVMRDIHFPPEDLSAGAMARADVRQRRMAALGAGHLRPLVRLVEELRAERPVACVPDFDPAGGGVHARVLFLLEKPGPMTAPEGGSGFISPCNDDPTARAMHEFMCQRGLPLEWCMHWNVVPWWDGTIKLDAQQKRAGVPALRRLLALLSKLRAIVLVGRVAQDAWDRSTVAMAGVTIYRSLHPSRRVKSRHPERWKAIPSQWPSPQDVAT